MKIYIIRSVKYFVALCVLYTGLMALMHLTGATALSWRDDAAVLLGTRRGVLLVAVSVLLAATYPLFGFVRRRTAGDIVRHRTQIENAFRAAGYRLCGEEAGQLRFRATALRRVTMMFEDEITVVQVSEDELEIAGIRRAAVRIAFRLETYIANAERR